MIFLWEAGQALTDRRTLATLYEVSTRTIRRYCRPVRYEPRAGQAHGSGGVALYDAFAAAVELEGIAPRPERTLAAIRSRKATA